MPFTLLFLIPGSPCRQESLPQERKVLNGRHCTFQDFCLEPPLGRSVSDVFCSSNSVVCYGAEGGKKLGGNAKGIADPERRWELEEMCVGNKIWTWVAHPSRLSIDGTARWRNSRLNSFSFAVRLSSSPSIFFFYLYLVEIGTFPDILFVFSYVWFNSLCSRRILAILECVSRDNVLNPLFSRIASSSLHTIQLILLTLWIVP
jgi:hypothetical protein